MKDYLQSPYIIDGIRMDATPMEMLASAGGGPAQPSGNWEPVVDETLDPDPAAGDFPAERIMAYLQQMQDCVRKFPTGFAAAYTKAGIARALTDALWLKGHFKLEDLSLTAGWKWDMSRIGMPAAFYASVEAACDYMDSLGIRLKECGFSEAKNCVFSARATLATAQEIPEEEDFADDDKITINYSPIRKNPPRMSRRRKCSATAVGGPQDWIVFVPFDTCRFRLGGSLLSQATGTPGGTAPEILDPDYFMDCFEVVRELVEDGIVTAGVTVGDGGILRALSQMLEGKGMAIDLGGMQRSYGEEDPVRLLLGEVPGVILEFKDADYDYIDAEFLLQDVAYYPLGHPDGEGLRIAPADASAISGILQSLLGEASEGED